MALDVYKEIETISEETLVECSRQYVIIKDGQSPGLLFGGTFDFDPKEPDVYYLREESVSRKGLVRNLNRLLVKV